MLYLNQFILNVIIQLKYMGSLNICFKITRSKVQQKTFLRLKQNLNCKGPVYFFFLLDWCEVSLDFSGSSEWTLWSCLILPGSTGIGDCLWEALLSFMTTIKGTQLLENLQVRWQKS